MPSDRPEPLPPLPEVPYVIGIHAGDGLLHAVDRGLAATVLAGVADSLTTRMGSECHTNVVIARSWGEFRRGNQRIDDMASHLCPHCTWTVALHHETTTTELAAISPSSTDLVALARFMPNPMLAVQICEHILARRAAEDGYDSDHPIWAEDLAHATAHRPLLLAPEGCVEDECDHVAEADCYTAAACSPCSRKAGGWAGEWEGQYLITVPAPCGVLPAMAAHYGLEESAR